MTPSPQLNSDGPDALCERGASVIADELVGLTAALSDLAYDLSGDPETVRRHMGSLQAIDLITQIHLALADLLRASGPFAERVNRVTVEAIADRMRAKLAGNDAEPPPIEPPYAQAQVS